MSARPPLTATYRVQLDAAFRLDDAREVVPYLDRLGVSHLYASPILQARPGSTHGYDVVDPRAVSRELGGDEARRALAAALAERGMGMVLDVVPNHMGTGAANPFWDDVLTHGQASRYAHWFDVDWEPPERALRGRVLLPVLGDELDAVIGRDELRVLLEKGRFRVAYFDHRFPLDPTTVHRLFAFHHDYRYPDDGLHDADEMLVLRDALIPERGAELDRAAAAHAVDRLAALAERAPAQRAYVEWVLREFAAGDDGHYRLRVLLDLQNYALAYWRRAAREINYRRFFDVNELVALRAEDAEVFGETHALVLSWIADGTLAGLRVDHVDGLLDPLGYLERLRAELDARRPSGAAPLFVEKILSPGERLRREWPVQGTTGYEFLNDLEALFIHAAGAAEVERAYRKLIGARGERFGFAEVAFRGKEKVLRGPLAADVRRLARLLHPVARRRSPGQRWSRAALGEAVLQLIAVFPVYRTYVDGRAAAVHPDDHAVVARALARARERGGCPEPLLAVLRWALLDAASEPAGPARDEALRFVRHFQQTSGPATAKGVEDTALYLYAPLASLNEVGGDPERELADAPATLHRGSAERAERWPLHLLATNTHDTKRSADVRARIDALSELPAEWAAQVERWRRANRSLKERVRGRLAPDAGTEYLLYQTLVGVWPHGGAAGASAGRELGRLRERVEAYMLKSAREAKARTSWTDPDQDFERALSRFVAALVEEEAGAPFRTELERLVARVAPVGMWTSLARVLVHLASPGTPDLYQGDELWSFSLVDPDNRRPVDYALRARLLDGMHRRAADAGGRGALCRELLAAAPDGRVKLFLTHAALRARRADPELFRAGAYLPLVAEGPAREHVFAFARRLESGRAAVVVVPRLTATLRADGAPPIGLDSWGDTTLALPAPLAGAPLVDALGGVAPGALASAGRAPADGAVQARAGVAAGDPLPVAALLEGFPVALLLAAEAG